MTGEWRAGERMGGCDRKTTHSTAEGSPRVHQSGFKPLEQTKTTRTVVRAGRSSRTGEESGRSLRRGNGGRSGSKMT